MLTLLPSPYGVQAQQPSLPPMQTGAPNGRAPPGMPGSAEGINQMGLNGQSNGIGEGHDGAFSQQLP